MFSKRTIFAVVAASLSFFSSVSADASDVLDLNTAEFDATIKENPLVLAEFFAPWCGHCKALAPEYEKAATELKDKSIKLAKVDCTVNAELCQRYGVQGYPTLKVFRGEENSPYQGARKAEAIVSYMIKQSLPAVTFVTPENFETFSKSDKVVVIGFFEAGDKASNETFTAVANAQRDDFLFGATNDASLAKAEGAKVPDVIMYKSYDDPKEDYEGKFDAAAIQAWTKEMAMPVMGEVNPDTYSGYMSSGVPLAYIFVENDGVKKTLGELLKPIAAKVRGKINFATIDAVAFGGHAKNLNLQEKWPAFAIQDVQKNQKFPYDQAKEITAADIEKFVASYLDGSMKPSIKSEPIPEKQEGPVTVVVAHSYKDIVLDDSKDVLIEFYAPWCGHCKNLAPKFEQLASLYAVHSDKVTIAKCDATANDIPDDVRGFPTLKLYPAGKKDSPVDYTGDRSVENLISFIAEKGAHGIAVSVQEPVQVQEQGKAAEAATPIPPTTEAAKATATETAKDKKGDEAAHDEL